jgi:hypothetical protein
MHLRKLLDWKTLLISLHRWILSTARVSPAEGAKRHQLLGRQLKIEMYFDG